MIYYLSAPDSQVTPFLTWLTEDLPCLMPRDIRPSSLAQRLSAQAIEPRFRVEIGFRGSRWRHFATTWLPEMEFGAWELFNPSETSTLSTLFSGDKYMLLRHILEEERLKLDEDQTALVHRVLKTNTRGLRLKLQDCTGDFPETMWWVFPEYRPPKIVIALTVALFSMIAASWLFWVLELITVYQLKEFLFGLGPTIVQRQVSLQSCPHPPIGKLIKLKRAQLRFTDSGRALFSSRYKPSSDSKPNTRGTALKGVILWRDSYADIRIRAPMGGFAFLGMFFVGWVFMAGNVIASKTYALRGEEVVWLYPITLLVGLFCIGLLFLIPRLSRKPARTIVEEVVAHLKDCDRPE
ncbi:hypothetical protein ACFL6M_06190 [Candidatus Eisenbacteria bacterium]|uniref:Uncharacterized protein n=1 Tax=Eiseniibacteriota bacterium TaxID=2212470 RepID=A0ABV6YLF6_UNCEI